MEQNLYREASKDSDCGVFGWPWRRFAIGKTDRSLPVRKFDFRLVMNETCNKWRREFALKNYVSANTHVFYRICMFCTVCRCVLWDCIHAGSSTAFSWVKDISSSASQGMPHILCNPKVHYSTHAYSRSASCPVRFIPDKEAWYPLNRRRCGPQSRCGRFWRRESLLFLPGFEPQTEYGVLENMFCLCRDSNPVSSNS
jgi:hypothetical protein